MSPRLAVAFALVLVTTPLHAEMRTDDISGVRIGMTPNQVIATLRTVDPADPAITTQPCAGADRYARTCITSVTAGPPTNQTSVFFVEDLPAAPGTMRVYAAVSIILSEPWTDREQAQWEAVVARDLGRPDCLQLGAEGHFRAWSRPGTVPACTGRDLPLPQGDDVAVADASPLLYPVIWEYQANTGRLHQLVLIDLGFYQHRKRAAAFR